jgi:hypothetical protein
MNSLSLWTALALLNLGNRFADGFEGTPFGGSLRASGLS